MLAIADQVWQTRPAELFNGSLLIHRQTTVEEEHIKLTGAFTEYRFYYAQKHSDTDFGLEPIAVSGLLICQEHLIFAQRSPTVTAYPGWLELVPSGSLDRLVAGVDGSIDFMAKLRQEYSEETGLPSASIQKMTTLALVYDPHDPVYDIACQIQVAVEKDQLLKSLAQSPEYQSPLAVQLSNLEGWLADNQHRLVPTSRAILAAWR